MDQTKNTDLALVLGALVECSEPDDDAQGEQVAEVSEAAPANWYLVRTAPGDERLALRWLARRRFGAFLPTQQRCDKRNPHVLYSGRDPVFPGWLFVFVWNIAGMEDRLRAVPGVHGILCYRTSRRPCPVPDGFVQRLRALSWLYDETRPPRSRAAIAAARHADQARSASRARPLDRRERRRLRKLKAALRQQGRWDEKAWANANRLEPRQRIRLLERALKLPALSGCPAFEQKS